MDWSLKVSQLKIPGSYCPELSYESMMWEISRYYPFNLRKQSLVYISILGNNHQRQGPLPASFITT
jgi:hypothetical protein